MVKFKGAAPRMHLPLMGLYGDAPGVDNSGSIEHAVWLWRMCQADDFVDECPQTDSGAFRTRTALVLRRGLRLEQKPGVRVFGIVEHPETVRVDHLAFGIIYDKNGVPDVEKHDVGFDGKVEMVPLWDGVKIVGHPDAPYAWLFPSDMAAIVTKATGAAKCLLGRQIARKPWFWLDGPGSIHGVLVRDVP